MHALHTEDVARVRARHAGVVVVAPDPQQKPALSAPGKSSAWVTVLIAVINVISVVSLILCCKAVYRMGFNYPWTLIALHFLTTSVVTLLAGVFGLVNVQTLPLSTVLKVSATQTAALGFVNLSLQYNSIVTYECYKVFTLAVFLCLQTLYLGRSISPRLVTSLFALITSTAAAIAVEPHHNDFRSGVAAGLLSCLATAVNQFVCDGINRETGVYGLHLLWHQAPVMTVMLTTLACISDDVTALVDVSFTPNLVGVIALSCGLAAVCNAAVFFLLNRVSGVTYQWVGHLKVRAAAVAAQGVALIVYTWLKSDDDYARVVQEGGAKGTATESVDTVGRLVSTTVRERRGSDALDEELLSERGWRASTNSHDG